MIKIVKKLAFIAVATLGLAAGISSIFQPSLALTNGGSITALGVPLTENFDTLLTTPATGNVWTDNTTIVGAYSSRTTYNAGTGSSNAGALYSFGVAGAGPLTDRALGTVGSGSTGTVFMGVRLTNNTGTTITSLTVEYTGEQWRNGGATSPAVSVAQTADFQYKVVNAGTVTGINVPATGWIDHDPLDFTSPTFGTSTATALDGNAAPNRLQKSATISVNVAVGQEIWLRWSDVDHAGNDHGLAIDDLSVTANGGDSAPIVTGTSPVGGATNVAINATVTINFSESVNATGSAFALHCPTGTPVSFTQSSSPGTSVVLTPATSLPNGTVCTVTTVATEITDTDAPVDPMAANHEFSFTTVAAPVDAAPAVTTTNPVNLATGVSVASNIVINFSESVSANAGAFAIACGGLQNFTISGSPAASFTLDPDTNLPYATTCTVSAAAALISDLDGTPDHPASDFAFSFTTADPPLAGASVIINEIDADTPGSDTAEFVELFDGGAGNTPLDGLAVVFYAGPDTDTPANTHKSYAAFDLDGFTTDVNGYFTLGNPGVPGVDLVFNPGMFGLLQNGADAVVLFVGNASDFPNGSAITTANVQDAIVYGTDDPTEAALLPFLNAGQEQVNENSAGSGTTHSNQRCPNGGGGARNTSTYRQAIPTPDGENNVCPVDPLPGSSTIVISQVYGGGGNTGASYRNDFVELYNRGGAPVDITGWSLQYASSTGSGWDFNKQPLAGTINPGEYYLISLASGGANGAPLPAANVTGGLINMSATNGKIALVDNFDALAGTCPAFSPHLKDLVGWGGANCKEGAATATAPSAATVNTNAMLRQAGGATDTDQNGADFVLAPANPRRTATIVELGPYVLSTDPQVNGSNAPRDATIQVTFTELVDLVDPWFTISCATTGTHDSATFGSIAQSHFITPNVNFAPGEQCTVTIFKDQVHDQDTNDSDPNSDTLIGDFIWTFTVADGTAPPYPASVHLTMGNPTDATADVGQPNNFLMEKPEFALSYDRDLGRPNWVSWHLSDEWVGALERVDTFRADPAIPVEWYRVQSFDFSGSGFDRGHMVPNADRDKETSVPINQATFLMTNMIAQSPDNNQGPWAALEGYLRTLTPDNELYIVAGGVGVGGAGSNGPASTIAGGHVQVPAQTWKVALVLPKALGNDVARVTCEARTIAVIMPNVQGIRNDPWENYLTTVDAVESLVGYDLFSNLPSQVAQCVEAGTNGNNPPLDSTPPAVTCAFADGAWHADNVSLSCTAADSGSGLASANDASFVLTTSIADGVENANAATNSRMVCDLAGNCAIAGPIAGNQIDRKDPVITLVTPTDGAVYQWNKVVTAAFSCADGGSGTGSCAGTVANGAAIDTASTGAKSFVVNASDAAGNTASVMVNYTVAANTITISNLPAQPFIGDSFVPAFSYAGNGVTSVTSLTTDKCSVSGGTVSFIKKGTCTLVAHATATATFDAVNGVPQSMEIGKRPKTISIADIPAAAFAGGSYVPVLDYDGEGNTHVKSETTDVCKVNGGTVRFVGVGICTLTASATPSGNHEAATGLPQSFVVQ